MRSFYWLAALLIPSGVWSQTVWSGRVVYLSPDSGEEAPLPGANVYWLDAEGTAITDANGDWKLEVPAGASTVRISYIGFQSRDVVYTGDTYTKVRLEMGEELKAAEVEAQVQSTKMSLFAPSISQTLNEKELCKAACCNLSESFETNASIDASFTDAVTGTHQIKMLGLSGRYVQMMQDNVPSIRGLSGIYGMEHTPGPWIRSIQIAKGTGSVTNGHESITGQINTTLKNPGNTEERFYFNAFHNMMRRSELNAIWNVHVSEKWSTALMLHGMYSDRRFDMNKDGFVDAPLKEHLIARNSWHYRGERLFGEYALTYITTDEQAGQMAFRPGQQEAIANPLWGAESKAERWFVTAKTGLLFTGQDWKSIGTQFSFNHHRQGNVFGNAEYNGFQQTFRANVLFASRLDQAGTQTFTTGLSLRDDHFDESLNATEWVRDETVGGAFFEYNFSKPERFTLVAGLRGDYNALFDRVFVLPRLHFRYSLTERIALKAVAGKGVRSAAVLMENVGSLASARSWIAAGAHEDNGFIFRPEEAWNFGLSYNQNFRLAYRDASLAVDAYHTRFEQQVVVDVDRNAQQVNVYNLEGASFSNSVQAEFHWSPARRLDVRLAYRWLDVQRDYIGDQGEAVRREVPMISTHRAFSNVAFETRPNERKGQWRFDATVQWVGTQRLPDTSGNPEAFQLADRSDDFVQLNGQVTWALSDKFEVYVGSENILNFMQERPILSADNPFGAYFDASMVWGPVFGRNGYTGLRWRLP